MEHNNYVLCHKCQTSFIDDGSPLCSKCMAGTIKAEDGKIWYKMRYSIIGVLEVAKDVLTAKEIISLFTWTCRECEHEEEMWTSDRCRQCCFWDNPKDDEKPTHFEPKLPL